MRPGRCARRREERGYVAVLTAIMLTVLVGLSAFAVDVGHWYLVGQQQQRAADAAALAGVTSLPDDPSSAYTKARTYATANGFTSGAASATVTPTRVGSTQLKVEVSQTVDNFFGGLLGLSQTTVARHAIAEFAGPVPLGSPCNRFGDDPDPGGTASASCAAAGNFFAMVGNRGTLKHNGDAFQNDTCSSGVDGCTGGVNTDFDPDGYFYTVTVRQPVSNLTIEAFDPAHVVTGGTCTTNNLGGASALRASDTVPGDPATRYQTGAGDWCTGDSAFSSGDKLTTRFSVRAPGGNPWDPTSWPAIGGCQQTFQGFNGDLSKVLKKDTDEYKARTDVAQNFRRWVQLCRVNGVVQPGTYAVQVKTNGLGSDGENAHNRFSLRAYGSNSGDKDKISVAGYGKMALYANTPSGTSTFYLARIPSNSSGQLFHVDLFDVGDGAKGSSRMTVLPPAETGGSFSGCTGSGPVTGSLSGCRVYLTSPDSFNGKWQRITVPIPSSYSCSDTSATGCWVRLQFYYGSDSNPTDTTSWTATLEGDPIRLVE
ncbi:hypothetical protein JQN72_17030 [Phycicoccus sp. CSK15P-2]|uniref:pilus assembly protein TadG-related protein n=1 Tax=Phycicoccus sp. CSK15P-2 TaxID=2807627 RepID=UPI001950924D|nr:pilus assembly protein TadG-related protein [Phycicoccus sp. CSK15P-2]MBM6405948.1 hypothetical protein [Phycicoccus sp. CSK15P-2]